MADGISGGNHITPVTTSVSPQEDTTTGFREGRTITSVPPESRSDQLSPPASPPTQLDQRTVNVEDGVTPTPGLRREEPEEVDDKTFEELQEIEDKALAESETLLHKTEELRVTDMALAGLQGQSIDHRHQLKVAIQMPDEPPPPVQLIPLSDAASERADLAKLQKIAYEVLKDHKTEMLQSFNPDTGRERIRTLQETLESNAAKMVKKDASKPSKWKQKFVELQQKQVHITANDNNGRTAEVLAAGRASLPEHLRNSPVVDDNVPDDSDMD